MTDRVRVAVVDDSAYLRKMLSHMLALHPDIHVVGAARDVEDGLELVARERPDVITVDLNMPGQTGVDFVRRQMAARPVAIVLVSSLDSDARLAVDGLDEGAIDFVQKPTGLSNERVLEMQQELTEKVLAAGRIASERLARPTAAPTRPPVPVRAASGAVEAVVLGLSTGGPQALRYLLSQLDGFPLPLACVLHMPAGYTAPFARKLDALFGLEVREAEAGLPMQPGRLILGQAGRPFQLRREGRRVICDLEGRPADSLHQPSVNLLFQSASRCYQAKLLAVVLTGMGDDGTAGAAWVKAAGGQVICEDESSCVVYGMPRSVVEAGLADVVRPLLDLPDLLRSYA